MGKKGKCRGVLEVADLQKTSASVHFQKGRAAVGGGTPVCRSGNKQGQAKAYCRGRQEEAGEADREES